MFKIQKIMLILFVLGTPPAFANGDHFGHIQINYQQKKSGKDTNKKTKVTRSEWIAGCRLLGSAMTPRNSPWFYGAFDTFSCHFNGKTVYGEKRTSKFSVDIVDAKSGVTLAINQYGNSRKDKLVLSKQVLEPTQNFSTFLRDIEFVDLLALSLSDSLPAAGKLSNNAERLKDGKLSIVPVRKGESPEYKYTQADLPPELTAFRLDWDSKSSLWRSVVVGKGKLELNSSGGGYYTLDESTLSAVKREPVFLHRSEGPQNAKSRWAVSLKQATKNLDQAVSSGKFGDFLQGIPLNLLDSFLSSTASGYFGVKYGLQVLPPEGELGKLLGKTKMISILVEVRSGPLKGLRYYYDKLPEEKAKIDMADGTTGEQYIGFSRHIIGYSFGLELSGVIDRITVDPKLGIWTFNARLPASTNENGDITKLEDFNLGRTFSLALEAGIESTSEWYVLRAWAGMDTGFSLLKSGGKVSSYRFGLDAFLTAGPEIPLLGASFKTTWILFYVFDRLDIKTKESIELKAGEDAITGVAYDAAYAGAGVAISW